MKSIEKYEIIIEVIVTIIIIIIITFFISLSLININIVFLLLFILKSSFFRTDKNYFKDLILFLLRKLEDII